MVQAAAVRREAMGAVDRASMAASKKNTAKDERNMMVAVTMSINMKVVLKDERSGARNDVRNMMAAVGRKNSVEDEMNIAPAASSKDTAEGKVSMAVGKKNTVEGEMNMAPAASSKDTVEGKVITDNRVALEEETFPRVAGELRS
jgi:hypothetical protein